MNFYKKILAIFLLSALLVVGCRKDEIIDKHTPGEPNAPTVLVEAGAIGRVFDENSEPVVNATVELAGMTVETDTAGVFYFNHLNLDEAGDFVTVEKPGYFRGSRRFYPTLGNENYIEIKLLPKNLVGTVNAAEGGTVKTTDGAMINLPAGGIIDADGNTFTGEVNVFAHRINPVADDLHQIMPGNLEGENRQGTKVVLETYGMMAVELESATGKPLNIGNDKKAQLGFPVPGELLDSAPSEIPLWYMDEEKGIWVEEGAAQMDGSYYFGEVTHFSFWNCDAPFDLIELKGCFTDENGLPLTNVSMKITNLTTGNPRFGYTDSDGCFIGKVPKDEPLQLELLSRCGVYYYSENIGAFAESKNLGTIQASGYSDLFTPILKGRVVDCDGEVMGDMILEVNAGGEMSYFSINGSGFEIPAEHCANLDSITIRAKLVTDVASEVSLPIVIYPDSIQQYIGDLTICSTDMPYVKVTIEDDSHTYFIDKNEKNFVDIADTSRVIIGIFNYTPFDSSLCFMGIVSDNFGIGDITDSVFGYDCVFGNLTGFFDLKEKLYLSRMGLTIPVDGNVKINKIGGVGGFVKGKFEIPIDLISEGKFINGTNLINPVSGTNESVDFNIKVEFNLYRRQ